MMFICGQSNRVWHYLCGKYPGSVGTLISPSYCKRIPIDSWMPLAVDNGAFCSWRDHKPWDENAWKSMIKDIRLTLKKPLWATVPDVVGNRLETIEKWKRHKETVLSIGWTPAFCVQDGMTPDDVPDDSKVIFVGGTDGWKFPNLPMWTESFPRVHCARVNSPEMFEACERLGCESIDGTGWFRDPSRYDKIQAVIRFIEGHRNLTPVML